jgi:hypothetical protein
MTRIRCETRQGLSSGNVVAGVGDVYGHRHFMLVDCDFLAVRDGVPYLPVGVVFRDREKGMALIEFAEEADSGAWRAWVPLEDLLDNNETPA